MLKDLPYACEGVNCEKQKYIKKSETIRSQEESDAIMTNDTPWRMRGGVPAGLRYYVSFSLYYIGQLLRAQSKLFAFGFLIILHWPLFGESSWLNNTKTRRPCYRRENRAMPV